MRIFKYFTLVGKQRSVEGVIPKEWGEAYASPPKCHFLDFFIESVIIYPENGL